MERFLIGSDCEVLVGSGLPRPLLPEREGRRQAPLLTQPGAEQIARSVADRLQEDGWDAPVQVLPDREEAKSLSAIEKAYRWLASLEVGRHDTLVAVGGGALTDAAGFVAATWMRGIEVVHFPTTLLGAVDAAIGGKTAVNVGGKNLVGLFWHPRRVVVDLDVLRSLPANLKREGAAEVIKAGLLADRAIVDAYLSTGLDTDPETVVGRAIAIKADIVTDDFTEQGRRAFLNLGHTVGHAIEFVTGLSHGEAVAIGLVAAAAVSEERLGFDDAPLILEVLESAGLPTRSPAAEPSEILQLIALDKKRDAEGVRMVLLEAVERPRLVGVGEDDLRHALTAIGL